MYTPIKLDKVRNLRYGMKMISAIEEELKTSIKNIDFNNMTMKTLATIVWGGLFWEDNTLTPDSVMDLIDDNSTISEVSEKVGAAMSEAFPEQKNAQRAAAKK